MLSSNYIIYNPILVVWFREIFAKFRLSFVKFRRMWLQQQDYRRNAENSAIFAAFRATENSAIFREKNREKHAWANFFSL